MRRTDRERRTINRGAAIAGSLLRDYLLAALRLDAIRDELNELVFDHLDHERRPPDAPCDLAEAADLRAVGRGRRGGPAVVARCLIEEVRETMERRRCQ